jgi:hypothetical protein
MELIFLDTSLLVAYYNADDVNHADAREFDCYACPVWKEKSN